MAKIENGDVAGYYDKDGALVFCDDPDQLPEDVTIDRILTRQMVEETEALFFDDKTGVRIW
jgi:hypothetical protein